MLVTSSDARGHQLSGHTTAVEGRSTRSLGYTVVTDDVWRTLRAEASVLTPAGTHQLRLERRPDDTWLIDGRHQPDLDGCVDVDLESSAVTNLLPVHRLALGVGQVVSVPAAFVRADDLRVERLEQTYDASGLVVDYPGIARRLL